MIKYVDIPGFNALGECGFCSHLYQWISETPDIHGFRTVLLVRAYDVDEPKLFKGNLYMETKKFESGVVLPAELKQLEDLLGKVKVCADFQDFIKGHAYKEQFTEFTVS